MFVFQLTAIIVLIVCFVAYKLFSVIAVELNDKKNIPLALLVIVFILIFIIAVKNNNINVLIIGIVSLLFSGIAIQVYIEIFFKSRKFNQIKKNISSHINNCNELNHYLEELKESYLNIESYNYGTGIIIDTSLYNYQRTERSKVIQSNQIHHCSASVCQNANNQPMKYLCKYFNIERNENTLSKFEKVLNDFISVEQGKILIKKERLSILNGISTSIPFIIKKFNNDRLINELGFETIDIRESYFPTFTFQYISAGGYSSSQCKIKLDIDNLNLLINYLNDAIKWEKSIAGQRALMTATLRDNIKKRDNYQCCYCGLGIEDEPNLLLEIDHIIPLSKGGLTTYNNLQTLCWKCNRSKGANI